MAGLGGLFGEGTTANQLLVWGVLNQVLNTLMGPFMLALANEENSLFPNVPLSPAEAASAAARHHLTHGKAADEAAKSGVDTDVLDVMIKANLRAPDTSSVFELYRRGEIGVGVADPEQTSVRGALTDAGIKPEWHSLLTKLAIAVPTPAEVMNAWLQGQIGATEAKRRYLDAGGDPTWFQTSYNANGQAPTPIQALELWNRGIIPEGGTGPGAVSYEQAFLEGPWRNKWLPAFKALREYLPPPRTVTAMYREGSINKAQAARYLAQQGLFPDTIALYLQPKEKAATNDERKLTKADLLDLYVNKVLTKAQAESALEKIGYTDHDAKELVTLTDIRDRASTTKSAVGRIRTLFVAGKISDSDATATLSKLGVGGTDARDLLAVWRLESAKEIKHLTAAQIESAVYLELIGLGEGMARLVAMGYSHEDAWLAMSVRLKGPAGPRPPKGT